MKLIIQIPCYNEEKTLPITLQELPREVKGFDTVEWLVVDDGSTDRSIEVAKECGVDHIVKLNQNKGLAEVFRRGLDACIKLGADVIVNTDADNQYNAQDIPKLVQPILEGKAEIVVGARPIQNIPHFSPIKKRLQKLGSWVVRRLSYTDIPDAPSGFRAISREAALKLNVFNSYTYTLETIVQAGNKNLVITSVPIRVNKDLRPSKLVKSIPAYISNSVITLFRIFVVYRPFKTFMSIGILLFLLGVLIGVRFLYSYVTTGGTGHIQSLILAGVFLGAGFQTILVGFLADLLAVNRNLLEDVQHHLRLNEAHERIRNNIARIKKELQDTLPIGEIRDSVTGLYTQRYMRTFLEREEYRTEYRNAPVGFILITIDQVQYIRDTYGNEALEKTFKEFGALLRRNTRGEDLACLYADATFLLLLPNAPLPITRKRANNLWLTLKEHPITYHNETFHVTVSLGVANLPNHGPDALDALQAAEEALNRARDAGGDQVMLA